MFFFLFKTKTAYELRISDWSSDLCSSDLIDTFAAGSSGRASSMDRQPHLFRCPGQHRHALRFIPEPTSGEYHIGLTFNPRRGRCFPAIIHHGWRSDAVYLRRQFGKTPAWSKEPGASGIASGARKSVGEGKSE